MTEGAAALAAGIAKSANIAGDPASKASTLRSELTGLLTAHVYLAGIAVFTAYSTTGGTTSPAYQEAADALDTNSQDLATQIGTVAGVANQARFLETWRHHIDDFIAYAKADVGNDATGKTTAQNNLQAYTTAAGSFFSDITGGALNPSTVAAALTEHVTSLEGAIDSLKTAVADVPVTTPPSFGPSASPSPSASGTPTASPSPSPTAGRDRNPDREPEADREPRRRPPARSPPPRATRRRRRRPRRRARRRTPTGVATTRTTGRTAGRTMGPTTTGAMGLAGCCPEPGQERRERVARSPERMSRHRPSVWNSAPPRPGGDATAAGDVKSWKRSRSAT